MSRYLLDTNIISLYARRDQIVTQNIHRIAAGQMTVSAISVMELEFGIRRNPDLGAQQTRRIRALLNEIETLPYETREAVETAEIRVHLETTRYRTTAQPIGKLDTMIAGTARARDLICVTRNMNEFARIPNLKLEDWTQA
ncbi:MAG: type II toxin-antitoxin system VapC family toxin [Pleurocapsa sp. SU_196_0]|nr:type II toxin-antitoxin system VapC family toxin [Pleurocapsa sp. SU_196_0]